MIAILCVLCDMIQGKIQVVLGKMDVVRASELTVDVNKFVVGRLLALNPMPLVSPGTGRYCVYYEITVEV